MNQFDLNRGDSVIIYGAGAFGRGVYNSLKHIYEVRCFIDKRVKTIEGIRIEVKTPEESVEYKSCVAIVCVHNANWHVEIAEDLYALGFEKIIFLAVSKLYARQWAVVMNKIYNCLLEEQYDSLSNIPSYSMIKNGEQYNGIIRENNVWVVAWCGKDMLYTYDEVDEHQKEKMQGKAEVGLDVPMIAFVPYTSLFRFFMYGQGNADIYINNMKVLNNSFEISDEEALKEQYEIYRLLENEFEIGTDIFQYAPIHVRWNQRGKGYFNIIDGHHRCTFYWLKGMQNMPVKMKREDYEKWMNTKSFWKVNASLTDGHMLSMKINHPLLRYYESKYMEYESTLLDFLQEWIFFNKLKFQSVLEIDSYQGYYAIQFYRMERSQTIECIVEKESEVELVKQLFALQYVPDKTIKIKNSLSECDRKYDLVLICGIYDQYELKEKMSFLKKIVSDTLFWQSKADIEEEKDIIMRSLEFKKYKYLGCQCIDGKIREVGVFSR